MNLCYLLWPRRKNSATLNPADVFGRYVTAIDGMANTPPSADDEKLLAQSWKLFDNESARRNSIDTRAAAIMSAIGLAATLVTGVGFTVLKDVSIPPLARLIFLLGYVPSLAYLVRTMLLLFQIQGEVTRSTPDPSDLPTAPADLRPIAEALVRAANVNTAASSAYDRRLACKIMTYTVQNYKVNNEVLEALFVAQRAFRNAILVIVLFGTLAGIVTFLNALTPAVAPYIIE
jgi:hypothetical protein